MSIRPVAVVAAVTALVALAACAEPLEFADWTVPVPDGTPTLEYAYVPIEERTQRIDVVEDLRIVQGTEPFYRLIDVEADAQGNIYAFDSGNSNIVAFDAAGGYLRTFGGPGQGPGEIEGGGRIAIAGDRLVHASRNRLNVWTTDGDLVQAPSMTFLQFSLLPFSGTDDGALYGAFMRRDDEGTRHSRVVSVTVTGELERVYTDVPDPGFLGLRRSSGTRSMTINTMIPMPEPMFASSRDGNIYVVAGDEYQVLAFAPAGDLRWALRTTKRRPPLGDERIEAAVERIAERAPGGQPLSPPPRRSEVDWPATLPALVGTPSAHRFVEPIRVDGHGHIYVFPFIPDDWPGPDQPVDVYSPDGERLLSGMMPIMRWDAARGDRVYGLATDPETEEYRVVRYRLVEPFD